MANNVSEFGTLSPLTAPFEQGTDTKAMVDCLTHELASRELDTRFMDALERGKIDGDTVVVDAQGNDVKTFFAWFDYL